MLGVVDAAEKMCIFVTRRAISILVRGAALLCGSTFESGIEISYSPLQGGFWTSKFLHVARSGMEHVSFTPPREFSTCVCMCLCVYVMKSMMFRCSCCDAGLSLLALYIDA
jgi:hypothetical protein